MVIESQQRKKELHTKNQEKTIFLQKHLAKKPKIKKKPFSLKEKLAKKPLVAFAGVVLKNIRLDCCP